MSVTLYEWMPGVSWWHANGFTREEIETGLADSGLKISDITTREVFDREPGYAPKELVEKNAVGTRHLFLEHKGHSWERTENFRGDRYLIRSQYAHLYTTPFVRQMLRTRLPWFDEFKWSIYGHPELPEIYPYEIYMRAQPDDAYAKDIYCPVVALLTGNEQMIVERCTSYAKSYNNQFYTPALLEAVRSPGARRLFDYLTGRVRYEASTGHVVST